MDRVDTWLVLLVGLLLFEILAVPPNDQSWNSDRVIIGIVILGMTMLCALMRWWAWRERKRRVP